MQKKKKREIFKLEDNKNISFTNAALIHMIEVCYFQKKLKIN